MKCCASLRENNSVTINKDDNSLDILIFPTQKNLWLHLQFILIQWRKGS